MRGELLKRDAQKYDLTFFVFQVLCSFVQAFRFCLSVRLKSLWLAFYVCVSLFSLSLGRSPPLPLFLYVSISSSVSFLPQSSLSLSLFLPQFSLSFFLEVLLLISLSPFPFPPFHQYIYIFFSKIYSSVLCEITPQQLNQIRSATSTETAHNAYSVPDPLLTLRNPPPPPLVHYHNL